METYNITNLTFYYPEKERPALKDINLNIKKGEFIALCGTSGCGKTTLLRHLKPVLTPHGTRQGQISFQGQCIENLDLRSEAQDIGYVLQSPDNQIVTDKVWHELAFGLESLGYDTKTIRLKVAEMASFFGIQTWFMKSVTELSGGQKQLLNLASIMAMQPKVLILDEPTSQLDPIAAVEFLDTIKKINRELGTTIIISEHRLEEVIPMADRVIVMDEGSIIEDQGPESIGEKLKAINHHMFTSMPTPIQIYCGLKAEGKCPITVRDGRRFLDEFFQGKSLSNTEVEEKNLASSKESVVKLKDVWFRYERSLPDVVKDLSLEICKGQIYCILGGNGTGKTTTLNIISGINKPYRGKVFINHKDINKNSNKDLFYNNLGVLPQNPQAIFVKKTVELDLYEMLRDIKITKEEKKNKIDQVSKLVEIEDIMNMHPYDLSGGEQQRAALAKVLLLEPKILLLDEPTKGLDNSFKEKLAHILRKLSSEGNTIIMVSHDIEFCARHGDMCSLFFDGNIVTTNTPNKFFSGNSFYTTAANRMSRHIFKNAITNEEVITLCQNNVQKKVN